MENLQKLQRETVFDHENIAFRDFTKTKPPGSFKKFAKNGSNCPAEHLEKIALYGGLLIGIQSN